MIPTGTLAAADLEELYPRPPAVPGQRPTPRGTTPPLRSSQLLQRARRARMLNCWRTTARNPPHVYVLEVRRKFQPERAGPVNHYVEEAIVAVLLLLGPAQRRQQEEAGGNHRARNHHRHERVQTNDATIICFQLPSITNEGEP